MLAGFDYELTKDEYVRGFRVASSEIVKRDRYRARVLFEQLALITVVTVGLAFMFPFHAVGLVVMVAAVLAVDALMRARWLRLRAGITYEPLVAQARVEFSDAGIRQHDRLRRREWTWDAVMAVHSRPGEVVFVFTGWEMLVLPLRLWPDRAAKDAFLGQVRERAGEGVMMGNRGELARSRSPHDALDTFILASIAAAVNAIAFVPLIVPGYTGYLRQLGENLGFAAGMALVLIGWVALGFPAYKAARAGLPRLHAKSPLAANIVAHSLIWSFGVYLLAANLGWI